MYLYRAHLYIYISTFPTLAESSTNQVCSQKTHLNSSDSTNKFKRKSNYTVSRPKNSRMPENINRVEDLAIFMILYMKICSMNRPQQLKPKSAKTREQNATYMREY